MAVVGIRSVFLLTLTMITAIAESYNVIYFNIPEPMQIPQSIRLDELKNTPIKRVTQVMKKTSQFTRDSVCPYPYGKNKINNIRKEWQKVNTGTYVYVYKLPYYQIESIIYIMNNKIVGYTKLSDVETNEVFESSMYHRDLSYLTKDFQYKDINFYLIKQRFDDAIDACRCFVSNVEINKKYPYIEAIEEVIPNPQKCVIKPRRGPRGIMGPGHENSYSYGLMMLPKDTKFTQDNVRKVISKYKSALHCEKDMLKKVKPYDNTKLTILEKAIGKERVDCFGKCTLWDKNGTK